MAQREQTIIPLLSQSVNVYLVRGERTIIVDAGLPGMADAILAGLAKHGVREEEVSLILITHGHPDHVGSAAELKQRLGVPLAIPRIEAEWLRTGRTAGEPTPARPFGRLLKRMVKPDFPACEADILLDEGQRLDEYGLDARLLHTPGHSPGSLSFLFPNGDCIAGDVMAGGFVRENRPDYPFFLDDRAVLHRSIARLVAEAPGRLYFGHGQPADATSVRRRFAKPLAELARGQAQ